MAENSEQVEQKPVLVDCLDGVEEYAWVKVSAADSPRAAVALATEQEPPADDGFYECTGKDWFEPAGEEEGTELWMPCDADAEGAEQFWSLVVAEPERASR